MKEIITQSSLFNNKYHFITEWRVKATCREVSDILEDASSLCKWWPSVYLDVVIRKPGDHNGVGKIVDLYTKGWLPYTIRWSFEVTESQKEKGFSLRAFGDLAGTGKWTFVQERETCIVTYDWNIAAEKPLFKYFSSILKPVFARNHYWAMKRGEESLSLELRRKRGEQNVPPPPPPSFPHNITNNKVF
jgi:hypothetical protein